MFTVAAGTGHVHQALADQASGVSSGTSGAVITMLVAAGIIVVLALRAVISAAAVLLSPVLELVRTGVRLLVTFLVLVGFGMLFGMGALGGIRGDDTAAGQPAGSATVQHIQPAGPEPLGQLRPVGR
jgi:hypothetical protein